MLLLLRTFQLFYHWKTTAVWLNNRLKVTFFLSLSLFLFLNFSPSCSPSLPSLCYAFVFFVVCHWHVDMSVTNSSLHVYPRVYPLSLQLMAKLYVEVFGEMLVTSPLPDCNELHRDWYPSPEMLRNKIILKHKRLGSTKESHKDDYTVRADRTATSERTIC